MFEKVYKAAVAFDEAMNAINDEWQKNIKEINKIYSDEVCKQKMKDAEVIYLQNCNDQKQKMNDVLRDEVKVAKNAVYAVVTAVVPADFSATLEGVLLMGAHVSEYECNAYLEKYHGNYLAYSSLLNALHENGLKQDVVAIKADSINEEIENLEKNVSAWVREYHSANLLVNAMVTGENNNPILKVGNKVQSFIDGGFAEWYVPVSGEAADDQVKE